MPAYTRMYGDNQLPKNDETMTAATSEQSMTGDQRAAGAATSRAKAEAAGFTVDTHVYPWFAYRGPRFRPTESRRCLTDTEAEMLTALKVAKANLQPLGDSPALDIICSAIERAERQS